MAYRITDIKLELESNKITISTILEYYTVIPEQIIPDPPNPDIIVPAYERIDWSKTIYASTKVDPFNNASLNAARTILVSQMEEQMKFQKRIRDKEFEIKNSGVLATLKTNIQTKLDALP